MAPDGLGRRENSVCFGSKNEEERTKWSKRRASVTQTLTSKMKQTSDNPKQNCCSEPGPCPFLKCLSPCAFCQTYPPSHFWVFIVWALNLFGPFNFSFTFILNTYKLTFDLSFIFMILTNIYHFLFIIYLIH